jgi:hypothetical protein
MKFEDPRNLVLNKEVKVSNGIHGHTHRPPNRPKKKYFEIQDLEI